MRNVKMLLVAVMLTAGVVYVSTASAELIGFEQCKESKEGKYTEKECKTEAKEKGGGKFEKQQLPAGTKIAFTSTMGEVTLETRAGRKVVCALGKNTGETNGPKLVTNAFLTLEGCKSGARKCKTVGLAEEEIKTKELDGELGYLNKGGVPPEVGEKLFPVGGTVAEFECTGPPTAVKVAGCGAIGKITPINQMTKTFELVFKLKVMGEQELTKFEGLGACELKMKFEAPEELAAIAMKDTSTFVPALEIRA